MTPAADATSNYFLGRRRILADLLGKERGFEARMRYKADGSNTGGGCWAGLTNGLIGANIN